MRVIDTHALVRRLTGLSAEFPDQSHRIADLIADIQKTESNGHAKLDRNGRAKAKTLASKPELKLDRNGRVHKGGRPRDSDTTPSQARRNSVKSRYAAQPIKKPQRKDAYTVYELAALVDRSPWTVAEWCKLGRVKAEQFIPKGGGVPRWRIPHSEFERYRAVGLRDIDPGRNQGPPVPTVA